MQVQVSITKPLDDLMEREPVDEAHDKIIVSLFCKSHVVYGHNIRVLKLTHNPYFIYEAGHSLWIR